MEPILIIIRGNSASGKTVLANNLQEYWGHDKCLLLHQDVIRREILHANDNYGTPAIELIETMAIFGLKNYPITILEGILRKDVYGNMLNMLRKIGATNNIFTYYLDVPFLITVKWDQNKQIPFGITKLKRWWREKDYLDENDVIINSEGAAWEKIVNDVNKKRFSK